MNRSNVLISCLICGILVLNINGLKRDEVRCGQNTLLCPCNGSLGNKHITINVENCLTKIKTCEACDRITNFAKCSVYQNYCTQVNDFNNGPSYESSHKSPSSTYTSIPCHCQNGGTCVYDSEGTCICSEEFEGVLCELYRHTEAPPLAKSCEIPESPIAGYIAYESEPIIPGEYIKYKCNEGYELYGNATRYCQESGNFDGVTPTCEQICQIPVMRYNRLNFVINPNHQRETEVVDQYGNLMITEIQFSCQDNFRLVGPSMIYCTNGIWNNKPPYCMWYGSACKIPVIQSQMMTQMPDMRSGAVIPESVFQYKCNNGTVMIGDPMIVCTYSGTWIPSPPRCLQAERPPTSPDSAPTSCLAPIFPENGFIRLNIDFAAVPGIKNDYSILPVRTQVLYDCRDGYRLTTSESTRTCLPDGRWNGKEPKCIPECGKPNAQIPTYILNGVRITIEKWPWQAGLYNYDSSNIFCGGSVLNERWVLTAAHCVTIKLAGGTLQQLKYDTYGVFFGQTTSQLDNKRKITIKRKVWSVIHHQDFNANTLDSDIALIMLEIPLTFSNEIRPVCLPTFKSTVTDITNSIAFVAGWGQTSPKIENVSLQLRFIKVTMVTNNVCKNANVDKNGFHAPITENMFCAAGSKKGSGTCHGDSGGSLCVKTGPQDNEVFQIEGIVSFGGYTGCGVTGQYDGFTKVRNFIDWIQSYIN